MRVAVFASGGGSNFQALIDRRESGDLHTEIVLLVGNNSTAACFERAKKHGIAARHIAPSHFDRPEDYVERLGALLAEFGVDLIALAGYMKIIPPRLVREYRNRIVNIHPGLLPAFGGTGMFGLRVHRAVLDSGAKISGVTVHFVDEEYDHGPIIFQKAVPVEDDDTPETLAARVLAVEHDSYWRVIEAIGRGRITVAGGRVTGRV